MVGPWEHPGAEDEPDDPHLAHFPAGFFDRADSSDDARFCAFDRFVSHIDDRAIVAVGELYDELGLAGVESGEVLDLCSSWISHFRSKPERLVVIGMDARELAANETTSPNAALGTSR